MGNFLSFKSHLHESYASYANLSLPHIERKLIRRFYQIHASNETNTKSLDSSSTTTGVSSSQPPSSPSLGNFGYTLDYVCWSKLFPNLQPLEESIRQFHLWDDDQDGLVEILQVFATCIILAHGNFEDKVQALFRLFDFDDSQTLSTFEFSEFIQHTSRTCERVFGTERMKELYQEEMEEVIKRGMMHLSIASSMTTQQQQQSSSSSSRRCQAEASHDRTRVRGKDATIPFDKFQIFCGVTPLILNTLTRHNTTDGDDAKAYWNSVLGGTELSATVFEARNKQSLHLCEEYDTLCTDARRINAVFKCWIPLHRHLLAYRAQHAAPSSPSAASASSSSAAAAAAALIDEDTPLPAKLTHHEVHSKFKSATQSSLARSKKPTTMLGSSSSVSLAASASSSPSASHGHRRVASLQSTLRALELKEHGVNGGGRAHEKALAAAAFTTEKATGASASTIPREKDEQGRHRPAYLAIQKIKSKIKSRRGKDDPHYQHFVYDHNVLRQAKHLFDSIDTDNSGEISISELSCSLEGNPHLGATISAFKSLDVDQTGTIEFIELLRALFPLATHHHVKMMSIEVKAIDITKKDMEILQKLFEWLDEDFDGKVRFRDLLSYLKDPKTDPTGTRKLYARNYQPTKSIYELQDERFMNFQDSMTELFTKSHPHSIVDIKRWAAHLPVYPLTDAQHVELEQLFALYDADGSGSIDMVELVDHFTNLGFTEEDNARMFRMFDRDGGGSVDMVEFKVDNTHNNNNPERGIEGEPNRHQIQRSQVFSLPLTFAPACVRHSFPPPLRFLSPRQRFYRSVYDSTRVEDYGRGVTGGTEYNYSRDR